MYNKQQQMPYPIVTYRKAKGVSWDTGRLRDMRRRQAAKDKYFNEYYDDDNDYDCEDHTCSDYSPLQQQIPPRLIKPRTNYPSMTSKAAGKKRALLGTAEGVVQPAWSDDELVVKPKLKKVTKKTVDSIVIACDADACLTNCQRFADKGMSVTIYSIGRFDGSSHWDLVNVFKHDGSSELENQVEIAEDDETHLWTTIVDKTDLLGIVACGISIAQGFQNSNQSQAIVVVSTHGGEAAHLLVAVAAIALKKLNMEGVESTAKIARSEWIRSLLAKLKRSTTSSFLYDAGAFFRDTNLACN